MKKVLAFLFVSVILLISGACTKTIPITVPATPTITTPLQPGDLANHPWILTAYGDPTNMTNVLSNWKDITLSFNGTLDRYNGSDGVNDYGGACHIENDNSIVMAVTTLTQVGYFDNPRGIIKQIQTYYDLLLKAKTLNIDNHELVIYCSNGQALHFIMAIPLPGGFYLTPVR
jgi:hypothetical protein